jgi:protein-tyrosine kinase
MGKTYEALQRAEIEYQDQYLTLRSQKYTNAPPPRQTKDERYKEQYEALKHSLLSSFPAEKVKTIAFTGPSFADGTSNTAVNLAAAMAKEDWRSILLVDADLRHPSLHEVFDLPKGKGLSDFLADENKGAPEFARIRDNFYLLTAGSMGAGTAGLFESDRFDALLKAAANRFNHVIIDCPPVLAFSETRVIGTKVGGVVLVLNSGETRINVALMVKKSLEEVNADILGVVLNRRRFYIPQWLYEKI